MGHCEMRLAVAGLDPKAITERSRSLANEDWSAFSPAEQAAFGFARKQANHPASITAADVQELVAHFGRERALNIIWWTSHCHYLTRIADAFQIPLERENVFDGFAVPREVAGER
jgi:alkylhydroperoxidase family enzyme